MSDIIENAFDAELSDEIIKSLVRPNDLFNLQLTADVKYVLADNVEKIDYGNGKTLLKFLFQNQSDLSLVTFTHFDLQHFSWDDGKTSLLDLTIEEKRNVADSFTVVSSTPRVRKSNGELIYPMHQRTGFDIYRENISELDLDTPSGRAQKAKFRKQLFKTPLIDDAKPLVQVVITDRIFALPIVD